MCRPLLTIPLWFLKNATEHRNNDMMLSTAATPTRGKMLQTMTMDSKMRTSLIINFFLSCPESSWINQRFNAKIFQQDWQGAGP